MIASLDDVAGQANAAAAVVATFITATAMPLLFGLLVLGLGVAAAYRTLHRSAAVAGGGPLPAATDGVSSYVANRSGGGGSYLADNGLGTLGGHRLPMPEVWDE